MGTVLKNKYWPVILLALIICFHLVNNYIWSAGNNVIIGVDVSNHLYFQLKFHNLFKGIISNSADTLWQKAGELFRLFRAPMPFPGCIYWPNFVYFFSSLFTLAFGAALLTVRMSGFVYLAVIFLSIYAIGKKMEGRAVGVLAALFVSMYPLIFESSRQYSLDLPLTAIVCLACLFLLRAERFTNLKYSLLLGLAAGIGMLIKGQFLIFMAAPLTAALGGYFFAGSRRGINKIILRNIGASLILAVLISCLWWAGKIDNVLRSFPRHISAPEKFLEVMDQVGRARSLEYYLYNIKALFFDSLGIVFGVIFLLSLVFFIRSKARYLGFILSWLLIPVILFSIVFVVKHERFLMPILPAIALVSAWGAHKLIGVRARLIIIPLLVIFSLAQYYALSYFNYRRNAGLAPKIILSACGSSSYGIRPDMVDQRFDREKPYLINKAVKMIRGPRVDKGVCKVGTAMIAGNITPGEARYWMYYFDPGIYARDWLEQGDMFYPELTDFNYMIISANRADGVTWPRGREFLDLAVRNRAMSPQMAGSFPFWEDNFNAFVRAEKDFELATVLDLNPGISWYIYKRK